jgi:hypothetical protein
MPKTIPIIEKDQSLTSVQERILHYYQSRQNCPIKVKQINIFLLLSDLFSFRKKYAKAFSWLLFPGKFRICLFFSDIDSQPAFKSLI